MSLPLAVQMFTVRDYVKTAPDFAATLEKIAAIGYPAVQLSAVAAMKGETPEVSAAQARKLLDENGLKCIATHRSWDDLVNKTEQEIEFHHTLGCDFVAIGGIPKSYGERQAEGYADFVREAVPVVAKLKEAGLRFGYHNHAHEFARVEYRNGWPYTLFDILVDESNADFLFEVDLYWVDHAGANPERWAERLSGRMPVIHLKDKEVVGHEPVIAPIGEGNLDWKHIIPACQAAGVEWYAIEQDTCRRDPFDCLASSFRFLSNF